MAAMICRVAETLERLGERVTERRCLSDEIAVIRAAGFDCRLRIGGECHLSRIEQPAAHRVLLTLMREEALSATDHERMQTVIAHLLANLQAVLAPDYVQWTDPNAVLTRAEFRAAVANSAALPAPVRVKAPAKRRRKRLPDVEAAYAGLRDAMPKFSGEGDTEARLEALRAAFRDAEPDSEMPQASTDIREPTAPLRLAVWMMTITLGLFALPVAAGLAVVNLLRGENLRLTSQTAALSGLFMVLAANGQIAQAAEVLQAVLP